MKMDNIPRGTQWPEGWIKRDFFFYHAWHKNFTVALQASIWECIYIPNKFSWSIHPPRQLFSSCRPGWINDSFHRGKCSTISKAIIQIRQVVEGDNE